ncbi:transaldolase family protein [Streptomyces bacillaris]|uniref:transaldolase family protein n=1 Tax=Streptomyces TaxID=1883 RepID=UPI0034606281
MWEDEAPRGSSALARLAHEGVSLWLDGVGRRSLADGTLTRWAAHAPVNGVLLSLGVLAHEVRAGHAGPSRERGAGGPGGRPADDAVQALYYAGARRACDALWTRFARTRGAEGRVTVELDPRVADDARATVDRARAAAREVNRPSLLVGVSATAAGLTAISDCVAEGIGVNARHITSPARYAEVAEACFEGLERAVALGRPVAGYHAVATFEAARMEAAVDRFLDSAGGDGAPLAGRTAQALARAAYQLYDGQLGSARWRRLRSFGASPQRLVWAAGDAPGSALAVRQVENLVAWSTVHVLPAPTLDALTRSGRLRGDTLSGESGAAQLVLSGLRRAGVDIERTGAELARTLRERGLESRLEAAAAVRDCWDATGGDRLSARPAEDAGRRVRRPDRGAGPGAR